MADPRLFVAVDTEQQAAACEVAAKLAELKGLGLKLGLEYFGAQGPAGIRAVKAAAPSTPIFLDLKFHDIPNTVKGVVRSVVPLEPALMTLHSSGGPAMMKAAVRCPQALACVAALHESPLSLAVLQVEAATEAARECGCTRPKLLAVTVLTSLDNTDLEAVGQSTPAEDQVVRLARLAQSCGMDGVVCSAREIVPIRTACGPDFILVVPGIRPAGADHGDQKRVVTPGAAITDGASCLVVGRPITQAADAVEAAKQILSEIGAAIKS
jgi:orotidine-5'-phosphate decarboxylase